MREVYDFYFDRGRVARFSGGSYEEALLEFQAHYPYEVEFAERVYDEAE